MSDWWSNQNVSGQQGTAGGTDISTKLQGIIQVLNSLVKIFMGEFVYGTFTLPAANSLVVTQTGIAANAVVIISALNASAATLMGSSKSLYYTVQAGTSFTVFTASGANAAGTEQFAYKVETP